MAERILLIPTHPGHQYHFARTGLPIGFLGHWDQFRWWRPQPPNVINLEPRYLPEHLARSPDDYARILQDGLPHAGGRRDIVAEHDIAWLIFRWQLEMALPTGLHKLYQICKEHEIHCNEWPGLLDRSDVTIVTYYRYVRDLIKDRYQVDLPLIEIGLDPLQYGPYTGETPQILTVIHSWKDRGWNYQLYREATDGLPARHIDALADQPPATYEEVLAALRTSRLYFHDGEADYTIALVEAMLTGQPIVSPDLPYLDAFIEDGVNGFRSNDPAILRDRCRLLLSDADLAKTMGARSRELALARFDENRWIRSWTELIRSIRLKNERSGH